jgi:hypothetical protein
MHKLFTIAATTLFLLGTSGLALAEGQGTMTEHRAMGMSMSEESMTAMHESMAQLKADVGTMRDASSNDIKLRMMEKHMNDMTNHMEMMMNVIEGKPVQRHDHGRIKRGQ